MPKKMIVFAKILESMGEGTFMFIPVPTKVTLPIKTVDKYLSAGVIY